MDNIPIVAVSATVLRPTVRVDMDLPIDVDRFIIEDDKFPVVVEKFHPVCVDNVLYVDNIPTVAVSATVLRPTVRVDMASPVCVDILLSVVTV